MTSKLLNANRLLFAAILATGIIVGLVSTSVITISVLVGFLAICLMLLIREYWLSTWLVLWALIQNSVLPLLLSLGILGSSIERLILVLSEVIVLVVVGITLITKLAQKELQTIPGVVLAYVLFVLFLVIDPQNPGVPISQRIMGARTLLIPVIYFLLGFVSFNHKRGLKAFLVSALIVGVVSSSIGILLVMMPHFLNMFNYGNYLTLVKGLPHQFLFDGLPGNAVEYFNGFNIHRLIGLQGDPLAAGYFLAILPALFLAISEKTKWKHIVMVILIVGVLLTVTRAAIIVMMITLLYVTMKKKSDYIYPILTFGSILIFGVKVILATIFVQNGDTQAHVTALLNDVRILPHILGAGLGAAGAWAYGKQYSAGIGENWLLVMYAQVGLAGTVLFFGFTLWVLVQPCRDNRYALLYGLSRVAFISYLFVCLASEELYTDSGLGFFWVFLGAMVTMNISQEEHNSPPKMLGVERIL